MRIDVAGIDVHLHYRRLHPGDEGAVWRCCARRDPRPTYAECIDLVSEQLTADDAADYLAQPPGAAVRRLLAVHDGAPCALVTAQLPASMTDTPTLAVDPTVEDLAGNAAWDGLVWLAQIGYATAQVTVHWPEPRNIEQFVLAELPSTWGPESRRLTFSS